MAQRIGGPRVTGPGGTFNPNIVTWGGMRSPLVLLAGTWNSSSTEFSRQWPLSVDDPPWLSYKYFKWKSGSLFRHARNVAFAGPPYFYCFSNYEDPEEPDRTWWGVGVTLYPYQSVDNNDFLQLIGEAIDTDMGTFVINADAHDPNQFGQTLTNDPPPSFTRQIYAIGKLTGF